MWDEVGTLTSPCSSTESPSPSVNLDGRFTWGAASALSCPDRCADGWSPAPGHPSKPPTRLHLPKFCSRTQINSVLWSVCLTHYDSVNCSPPGSSVHGDSPGKNTGVGNLSLLQGNFLTQESNWGLRVTGRFFTS